MAGRVTTEPIVVRDYESADASATLEVFLAAVQETAAPAPPRPCRPRPGRGRQTVDQLPGCSSALLVA